jgi:tol-pal system protein YbgF
MSDRELAVIRNDVDRMNRQLLQLQVGQELAQARPREIVQRELEGDRRNIADTKAAMDELKQQVGVLVEKLEETEHQFNQRLNTLEAKLTSPAPQAAPGSESASPPPGPPAPSAPPAGPAASPAGPQPPADAATAAAAKRVYQAALTDYQRGKFDLAVQGFRTYLNQAPRGDVADTAQYYLAESLDGKKDFRDAIAEYDRLLREFPQSPLAPKAMFKAGLASYAMKDNIQGRRWLRTLIEKYPTTTEAKLAEERLRQEDRVGSGRPTSAPARR